MFKSNLIKIRTASVGLALLLMAGCADKGAIIKGTLLNAEGETIVLERLSSSDGTAVDSVEVDDGGAFKLETGEISEPGFYRLRINTNNFVILLLDAGEKVAIGGNALDFYNSYEVSGSEGSHSLRKLDRRLRADFEKTDSLKKVFQAHQQAGHPRLDSIAVSIDQVYNGMKAANRRFVIDFIKEHPTSLASLSAVQSLSPQEDMDVFEQVAKDLSAAYPNSEYVAHFKKQLTDVRSQAQVAKRTGIGSEAPEIVVATPDGQSIKLSDFRGKVCMIDFWASWCKPCRMENPNVVRVYNRFKDKGFEIFGVSLDKDRDQWVAAIEQDGLRWKHGSDLQFWQSACVPAYNLNGIPMTYLLDENGIIIAKGLRGQQLEQKLEQIFGKS